MLHLSRDERIFGIEPVSGKAVKDLQSRGQLQNQNVFFFSVQKPSRGLVRLEFTDLFRFKLVNINILHAVI